MNGIDKASERETCPLWGKCCREKTMNFQRNFFRRVRSLISFHSSAVNETRMMCKDANTEIVEICFNELLLSRSLSARRRIVSLFHDVPLGEGSEREREKYMEKSKLERVWIQLNGKCATLFNSFTIRQGGKRKLQHTKWTEMRMWASSSTGRETRTDWTSEWIEERETLTNS